MIVSSPSALARDQRRRVLMAHPRLKGLDSVHVASVGASGAEGLLWELHLKFVPATQEDGKSPFPTHLAPGQIRILLDDSPDSNFEVVRISDCTEPDTLSVLVRAALQEGYSQEPPGHLLTLEGVPDLDPFFSSAPVTFRIRDPRSRLVPVRYRVAPQVTPTDIDYLARDFESFRMLLLERMSFFVPEWNERNASDLGVTVVEVLAYAADYLSYFQDSVATEAYLESARRRISVRRHSRLLDFRLNEGTNARAWVNVQVHGPEGGAFRLPEGTRLLTASERISGVVAAGSPDERRALEEGALCFQTLHEVILRPEHDELRFYTWGADDYLVPRGSTSAALHGRFERLEAGDVLVIERREGHDFEDGATTDPRQRQALRLVRPPIVGSDPLTGEAITEIEWHATDALVDDYPVSRRIGSTRYELLSLLHGNAVLADHGLIYEDLLEPVPEEASYRPAVPRTGITFRQPFDAAAAVQDPARWAVEQDADRALPDLVLYELPAHHPGEDRLPASAEERSLLPIWRPRHDLLGSGRFARDFVAEVDERGRAQLRFGDGRAGRKPPVRARFLARYRIGNGPHGNIGAHALQHVVLPAATIAAGLRGETRVVGARNYLAGTGGSKAKPTDFAKVYAPESVHSPYLRRRCVTETDFAEVAERHPEVRRAVARLRWTGSATVAFLYVQRRAGVRSDPPFERRLAGFLRPFLMTGFDLAIREPHYVPLDIDLVVITQPGVREEALYRRFFNRRGESQLFDPDQFSFGRSLYLSNVTAQVMAVPGVANVRIERFQRWGQPSAGELEAGVIPIGPLEILRVDNNPAAPQLGSLRVRVEEVR